MREIQTQISKLTSVVGVLRQENGKFPSQPQANPQGLNFASTTSGQDPNTLEHVKSITTLRSGKEVDKTIPPKPTTSFVLPTPIISDPFPSGVIVQPPKVGAPSGPTCPFPAPYPQRLRAPPKPTTNDEIYELFKQVKINIPLLDALKQIPSYAKFLKDLCTVKRKLNVQKKVFLTEQVSSIILTNTAPKYKDPGCPTISIVIGGKKVEKAMLDLGASVNLLPYSVYEELGLGEMKPTRVTLQLADRSIRIPKGLVEDVLVQVDNFVYPVDFVVLDTCPVLQTSLAQTPIILGRPFLATSNAVIHCRSGLLNMTFGNMKMELNIFNVGIQVGDKEDVGDVSVIDTVMQDQGNSPMCDEPLAKSLTAKEMDEEIDYLYSLLERQDRYGPGYMSTTLENSPPIATKVLPSNLSFVGTFPGEQVVAVPSCPWLTNIDHFCDMGELSNQWDPREGENFLVEVKSVLFDAPYLFKYHPPDNRSVSFR